NIGVHVVGDIMKDIVCMVSQMKVLKSKASESEYEYYYCTIHRPYNTDDKKRLQYILETLNQLDKKVIFSIHPRTTSFMSKHNIERENFKNIHFIEPQPYFDNLSYLSHAAALITDSGGMQKEAYWLNKKCITIRKET